jgi:hypothetical protein
MTELEQKALLVQRIIAHLNPVPANAVQELLGESFVDLQVILGKLAATKEQAQAKETAQAELREVLRQRAYDGAWALGLVRISLNGKRLADVESNRAMLESLLNPGEQPTTAIYNTFALQFPTKFSWELPRPKQTDADREAEFVKVCHENLLSLCDANRQMFKDGVALEHFAGASGVERAAFQAEAQAARQKFLINQASPTQLKQEAAWESQQNREQAQREEADRAHQFVSQAQAGLFPPLPATHAETGEAIDARWLRKTSTVNFELFKRLCRRHGSAAVTSRLRGEN